MSFFFKQRTAYEVRISDWSSDVCSSDLLRSLRGKDHVLISAAVIALGGQPIWRAVDEARLTVRNFSDSFLKAYLDHEWRSEEHTSELQSLMRISYAVFCLKKKTQYERYRRRKTTKRE